LGKKLDKRSKKLVYIYFIMTIMKTQEKRIVQTYIERTVNRTMGSYQIITDSTSDLTQELVDELGVDVIPMDFTLGTDAYRDYPDNRDISPEEFYRRLTAGEDATTAQISMAAFMEAFETYLKAGKDVIYFGFSSGMSGTYNNSVLAAKELSQKYPERKILTVDTLGAAFGEGLLVWYAVQKQREGATMEELKEWAEQFREHLHYWFTVDDLNHLKRGGRISSTAALMGTMLGIKPVLHINKEGCLAMIDKVRGRRQALDDLLKHMELAVENPQDQMIFISHSAYPEGAEYMKQKIAEKFGVTKFCIAPIGPVIGAHTGAGAVLLFFAGKDREYGLGG
jgi:DegV family protein with EDD domain